MTKDECPHDFAIHDFVCIWGFGFHRSDSMILTNREERGSVTRRSVAAIRRVDYPSRHVAPKGCGSQSRGPRVGETGGKVRIMGSK